MITSCAPLACADENRSGSPARAEARSGSAGAPEPAAPPASTSPRSPASAG